MKRLTSILFLVLLALMATAQNSLSGRLMDAATRQPLDFANVSVSRTGDTAPLTGTVTDEQGKWEIGGLENGSYTLTFSFMGYIEQQKTATLSGKPLSLGKIYLEEDARQLEEVEVVGQNATMRFELDRKVFAVDQNIAAAGGSITDALENIPTVDVDQEGNIALRNNEAVEIWINGKPAGLTAENRAQVLQQLPAESIQEIEIITNPSAKFSPEGTAGIINLVMKKDRKTGYYGSVNAGIQYVLAAPWTTPPGGNAGLNINLSKGIIDAYFNAGYHYHSSHGSTLTDRHNLSLTDRTDTLSRLQNDASNDRRGGGAFLRAGIDLRITDRSTLGLSGFGMVGTTGRSDALNRYLLTDGAAPYDTLRQYTRREQGTSSHPGGNAMLTWQFKPVKGHQLDMSASYNHFTWNQYNTYTQAEQDTTRQKQDNENRDQMVQIKADYEWKPTTQSRLEAGWQTDLSWRKTNADAAELMPDATQQAMQAYYNDFLNREQIHALYVTYGNRFWDRFSVQVGLRGEYMQRTLTTSYYDAPDHLTSVRRDTSYFQLYPSSYLSYTFPKGHELQLNYTRRVDRPRGHQINPRQDFSDSTNIQLGNPDLLPAYSSSLELNYLKTWERHTLSAGLFWRYADGIIQNVKYMQADIMKNTFINIANRSEYGVEVVGKNRLFGNLLQLTTSANLYYNTISAADYHSSYNGQPIDIVLPKQNILTWSVRLNAQFMFTKTFSGQLSARYHSPRVVAQGETTHHYSIDLGLRKTFFDKKLALAFNVRDLLNSRSRANTTWGDGFYQYQARRWNSRTIGLTVTYSFGNMKAKHNQRPQDGGAAGTSYEDSGEE